MGKKNSGWIDSTAFIEHILYTRQYARHWVFKKEKIQSVPLVYSKIDAYFGQGDIKKERNIMISFIALCKLMYVKSHVYKLFWLKFIFSKYDLSYCFLSCVFKLFLKKIMLISSFWYALYIQYDFKKINIFKLVWMDSHI